MDARSDTNEWAAAGANLSVGGERRDDRLDAALAFLLAFGVLGSVWWYAAQPLGASPWPAKPTHEVSSPAPLIAATPAESAVPVPMPRSVDITPDTTTAPLPLAVPEVSAPLAVAPVIAAAPVVAAPAPVIADPVVVEPAPPVVAAVQAPVASAAPVIEPAPVEPAAPGPKVIVRENIQFAVNQSVLPDSAKERLDEIAKTLAADPRSLKIAGHSDASGPRGANVALSLRRAQAVREYLVAKGVPAEGMNAVGFGPDQPIASNKTEEGRAKNRRIDITE